MFESKDIPKDSSSASLRFIWFEICTTKCNERCIHCYTESEPKKTQPISTKKKIAALSYLEWCKLIEEAHTLGCGECQFIGGEPFLYKGEDGQTVLNLAEHAVKIGYRFVEIFSNLTLVKSHEIERIKKLGLKIATTIYSSNEKIHDAVTRISGSYKKTIEITRLLISAGVPVRAEIVITKVNKNTIEETIKFRGDLGIINGKVDVLRPTGRGSDLQLPPSFKYLLKFGLITKPDFCIDQSTLCNNNSFNSCLKGKLVVTEFGDFLPCIFSRGILLGNYQDSNLRNLIQQENIQRVWKSTKDDVLVCKNCEYRYCCNDCRAVSFSSCGEKVGFTTAPYPRCTYNPYTGEWSKGVWVINKNGEPFYDRELERRN